QVLSPKTHLTRPARAWRGAGGSSVWISSSAWSRKAQVSEGGGEVVMSKAPIRAASRRRGVFLRTRTRARARTLSSSSLPSLCLPQQRIRYGFGLGFGYGEGRRLAALASDVGGRHIGEHAVPVPQNHVAQLASPGAIIAVQPFALLLRQI